MTAFWISLAVVAALLLSWRLRKAAKTVDRILREEREPTEPEPATTRDEEHVEQQNR